MRAAATDCPERQRAGRNGFNPDQEVGSTRAVIVTEPALSSVPLRRWARRVAIISTEGGHGTDPEQVDVAAPLLARPPGQVRALSDNGAAPEGDKPRSMLPVRYGAAYDRDLHTTVATTIRTT